MEEREGVVPLIETISYSFFSRGVAGGGGGGDSEEELEPNICTTNIFWAR